MDELLKRMEGPVGPQKHSHPRETRGRFYRTQTIYTGPARDANQRVTKTIRHDRTC